MKNILKKIIKFFKGNPIYKYTGTVFFVTISISQFFLPEWLASWIFYFSFYSAVSLLLLFEMYKTDYFLYKRNKKGLYNFISPRRKPNKMAVTLHFMGFFVGIFLLFYLFPAIKYTMISLIYGDVSIKKIYTVESYNQGAFGWSTHINIADPEFNIGGSARAKNSLNTYLFLQPHRPKEGQRYYFHHLPLSPFLRNGVILDYYPVDENENKIPWD